VLLCPPSLERLFASLPGIDTVITDLTDAPAFDWHASLVSLPALLGTTLDSVPADLPYLRSPPGPPFAIEAAAGTLKVGLV
jgi:hypothetical protein